MHREEASGEAASQKLPVAFWYLWTGMLISRLGGFVFTFLALYLTEKRGFSIESAGLVLSLYGAGSLLAGPIGGALADRVGRRFTMLLGLVGSAAALVHLGLSQEFGRIMVGSLVLGCLSDLGRPAAQATIADLVPPEQRTHAYALMYWAINLGFAGAAMLAGLLAKVDFVLLFIGDAITSLCFGLIVFLRVPETRPTRLAVQAGSAPLTSATASTPLDLWTPYRDPVFVTLVLIQFTVAWVFCQGIGSLPLDMGQHGISTARYGQLIAINGVLIVCLQPLAVRFIRRMARARALALGAALNGIGFGLCALGHSERIYAISIVIWTLGEIVLSPVVPTLVADLAPPELRGSYQGGYQLCWGGAALLGPALGGLIMGRLGSRALWLICLLIGLIGALLHLSTAAARRQRLATMVESSALLHREDGLG